MAGIIAMPAVREAFDCATRGDWKNSFRALGYITGVDSNGKWSSQLMMSNLLPPVAGIVAHKVATMAGINRVLAKAKIPLVRI